MAMHQQLLLARLRHHLAAEAQQRFDMVRLRHLLAGLRIDRVVEAQLQLRVLAIGAEGFELRMTGIEDRQDMRDARRAVVRQFLNAADREHERHGR